MSTDKVIDKVRKLMAVAHGTAEGGEHERDTALKMALNLLAKHNLSMGDLAQPTEDRLAGKDEYHSTPWMRFVGHAIADLFFCSFFSSQVSGKNKRVYTFVGLEGNVATAREMTAYVIKSIQAESNKLAKAAGQGETWANSFRKGAASKISQRCAELRRQAERDNAGQASSGTSLVLASLYGTESLANKAYIANALGITLTTKAAVTRNNRADGVAAGLDFGSKLSLNKQVGSKDSAKQARLA